MAVPPDVSLEGVYAAAAARARRRVAGLYPLEACPSDSPDYPIPRDVWREVWRVTMTGGMPEILLAIPLTFPDALPVSYVAPASRANIPHLDHKGLLCTFDAAEISFDARRPEDLALGVLEKASEVWRAGALGTNAADYQDEFSAYWEQKLSGMCLSLVTIDGTSRTVTEVRLDPPWRKVVSAMFADRNSDAERWLTSAGYDGRIKAFPALYLPVTGLGTPPFPMTNADLYRRLRQTDADALERLLVFLRKEPPRPAPVLFSIHGGESAALGAWRHPEFLPVRTVMTARGVRRKRGVDGFRAGKHPAAMEINGFNGDREIERLAVKRVDTARLVHRTSGDSSAAWQLPVNLIGCGSVGGFVAEGLARSGRISGLRLVDPDILTPENTLRHPCGMSDIFTAKALAMKESIQRRFPSVVCETFQNDICEILRRDSPGLAGSSLTIVAVGNLAAERRVNSAWFAMEKPYSPCLCFTWVEPHLYGGHAVLVRPGGPGCFECILDTHLGYIHRIVESPAGMIRREAGCQSSFVPYGGTDLTAFTSALTRFLLLHSADEGPLLFSWIGDLDHARERGVGIRSEYAERPSFSVAVRPLAKDLACVVCRHG